MHPVSGIRIQGVGVGLSSPRFQAELTMNVEGIEIPVRALVLDELPVEFLLGFDFMDEHGVVLDMGRRKWYGERPSFAGNLIAKANRTCRSLVAIESFELEEDVGQIVRVKVPGAPAGIRGLVESWKTTEYGFAPGMVETSKNGEFNLSVGLIAPGCESVKVSAGEVVGYFAEIQEEDTVTEIQDPSALSSTITTSDEHIPAFAALAERSAERSRSQSIETEQNKNEPRNVETDLTSNPTEENEQSQARGDTSNPESNPASQSVVSESELLSSQRFEEQDLVNVGEDRQAEAVAILQKHKAIFSNVAIGTQNGLKTEMEFTLAEGAKPVKEFRPQRNPFKLDICAKTCEDHLKQGAIEPSTSPWCSPVVLVKKKSGEWRMCCDFRKLNAMTVRDSFPLPRI